MSCSRFAAGNAVFSPLAYFLIDRLGRRTLLLSSLLSMFPFLLLIGYLLDVDQDEAAIVLFIIYTALYSPGAGVSRPIFNLNSRVTETLYSQVIPFMYSSEVFPQLYREVGMSFACAVNFSFAGALAMAVPQYTNEPGSQHFKLLGTFAGLDALAAIMVWLFMRSPDGAVELEAMNVRNVYELICDRPTDTVLPRPVPILRGRQAWALPSLDQACCKPCLFVLTIQSDLRSRRIPSPLRSLSTNGVKVSTT